MKIAPCQTFWKARTQRRADCWEVHRVIWQLSDQDYADYEHLYLEVRGIIFTSANKKWMQWSVQQNQMASISTRASEGKFSSEDKLIMAWLWLWVSWLWHGACKKVLDVVLPWVEASAADEDKNSIFHIWRQPPMTDQCIAMMQVNESWFRCSGDVDVLVVWMY